MKQDCAQSASSWDEFWLALTPESEIRMWDFYGGRPWVLKHVPRYGKVLEAGCGLGRYVFLLSKLGIDINGLDFHRPAVEAVSSWAKVHGFDSQFIRGDVKKLPYVDESLAGYLSFGVIEHFQEGPAKVLVEAYRVLCPGGIAIISVPSLSFSQRYLRLRRCMKQIIMRILKQPMRPQGWVGQYWYTLDQLASFIEEAGLKVVLRGACDLKYAFFELGAQGNGRAMSLKAADWLERNTPLVRWGAQAFVVAIKPAARMYCFLCGEKVADVGTREHYLPICSKCVQLPLAKYYSSQSLRPSFHAPWKYNPPWPDVSSPLERCHFCGTTFKVDLLFDGDYGFSVPICPSCLMKPTVNILASNEYLEPRWRSRK